jgi:SNF2 family DNA or RNA helicase
MTSMLSILEDYLRHRGWGYERLDGSTALMDR